MDTLYKSLRIVVWRPSTFEDLFIRMTTGRSVQDRNKYVHLTGLFPVRLAVTVCSFSFLIAFWLPA